VVRASGGLFYDNFLLQNAYQDRVNRCRAVNTTQSDALSDGSGAVSEWNAGEFGVGLGQTVDIATQICGQPIGTAAPAIEALQSQFMAAQTAATGANVYSLANSLANFGGLLAPSFKTPRVVHMSAGIQRQVGERGVFSADYVREIGTQFPLGIDTTTWAARTI